MWSKLGLLIGVIVVVLGLGGAGRYWLTTGEKRVGGESQMVRLSWNRVGEGKYELVVDGGERKVTAVQLKGEGEVSKIEVSKINRLMTEVENKIDDTGWSWAAVVMGPSSKLESGKQVWATVMTSGKGVVEARGTVILAGDGEMPASEVEVGAKI